MNLPDRDFLVLDALHRALVTMQLIQAGNIDVDHSGYVINLSADIRRLQTVVALMEQGTATMH